MFTQPCFIRKNTQELRGKLEELGYEYGYEHDFYDYSEPFIACEGKYYWDASENAILEGFLFCGTNEELFLSIAALRYDTDKNQWFIYDKSDWSDKPEITYFICKQDSIKDEMCIDLMYNDCHKATVKELIKYFKDKHE